VIVLAHPGHWLVNVAYFAPVAGFLIWLAVNEVRTRREKRAEARDGGPPAAPAAD
jgi:hypothetical protein